MLAIDIRQPISIPLGKPALALLTRPAGRQTSREAAPTLDLNRQVRYLGFGMGINYAAIGIGIGLLLSIWALVVAETGKARAIIGGSMALIFCLPIVWRAPAGRFVSFIAWTLLGIACFIYVRWKGEGGFLK